MPTRERRLRREASEKEFLQARSALMRSIQRTNKAFGSSMKIDQIVDVPTPAQAKRMSKRELDRATRRIREARTDEAGNKVTYVPMDQAGSKVMKVPTKTYNKAMSDLGKSNKEVKRRADVLDKAKVSTPFPTRRVIDTTSRYSGTEPLTPYKAFVRGARGHDKIMERFERTGETYGRRQEAWRRSDERMRSNFMSMLRRYGRPDIANRIGNLSMRQFLYLVHNGNLRGFLQLLGLTYSHKSDDDLDSIEEERSKFRGEQDIIDAMSRSIDEAAGATWDDEDDGMGVPVR